MWGLQYLKYTHTYNSRTAPTHSKTAPPPAAVPTMIMLNGVVVCKEEEEEGVHPCVGSQVEARTVDELAVVAVHGSHWSLYWYI